MFDSTAFATAVSPAGARKSGLMTPFLVVRVLTAAVFLFFGVLTLVSPAMIVEFERFGLPHWRVVTAVLEIAGGLGLVFGPKPHWLAAAAAGLGGLMIGALVVRLRIDDPWYALLPAASLLLVNAWIAARAYAQAPRKPSGQAKL